MKAKIKPSFKEVTVMTMEFKGHVVFCSKCGRSAYVVITYIEDQVAYKLWAKEVLIDDDNVNEYKGSTENKPYFISMNKLHDYQLFSC